jgi:hypothetical protein
LIKSRPYTGTASKAVPSQRATWFPWWALIFIIAFAVGTIWLRLDIIKSSYEVSQTDALIRNVKKENENLSLDLARLKSPLTLKKMAREKFKLDSPLAGQVIYLKDPVSSQNNESKPIQARSKQGVREEVNVTQAHPRSN